MTRAKPDRQFKMFTSYKIDPDVHTKLKHMAVDQNTTLQSMVNHALREFIARKENTR